MLINTSKAHLSTVCIVHLFIIVVTISSSLFAVPPLVVAVLQEIVTAHDSPVSTFLFEYRLTNKIQCVNK